MRICVTGASGFVGRALCTHLESVERTIVKGVYRHSVPAYADKDRSVIIDSIDGDTDWSNALLDTDVIIHTAARVHIMSDTGNDSLPEYRQVNVDGTLNLAHQAVKHKVKRLIFLSSVKVNGEGTLPDTPFREDDCATPPIDPYAFSKYEAEQGLLKIAAKSALEVVIIRPPLVYGPEVRANFASMMKWMNRSIPLPFGAIHNQRSLVALDNLVDFIALCADRKKSPQAANQIFLISDGEDVSTTQLLRKVAKALNKQAWLIPVPVFLMTWGAKLLGKGEVANRLFGSLQVDSAKARNLLGWQPVTTMDEQLKKAADAFLNHLNSADKYGFEADLKRFFDFILTVIAGVILIAPIFLVAVVVKLTSKGSVLYWSDRVGKNNQLFKMPKFRSMKVDTPAVATHILKDPKSVLTPVGDFLRRSSLDELPQLWCILKGDMSFVGPRPALFNQDDLITLRTKQGVDQLLPGLTGWAQINGRDELPIPQKVALDVEYLNKKNFGFDLYILWRTFIKVIKRDGVSH